MSIANMIRRLLGRPLKFTTISGVRPHVDYFANPDRAEMVDPDNGEVVTRLSLSPPTRVYDLYPCRRVANPVVHVFAGSKLLSTDRFKTVMIPTDSVQITINWFEFDQ